VAVGGVPDDAGVLAMSLRVVSTVTMVMVRSDSGP
jgi:hypothetical protein